MSDDFLKFKLDLLQVASCTCGTKTPEAKYHTDSCRYRLICEIQNDVDALRHQLAEATRKLEEARKDAEPDMFWDAANPEDSFNENPHELACTLSENLQLGEEAVFDIQCAISLADRKMRVKLDANGDFDWEWVDQAVEQGKGGDELNTIRGEKNA